MPNVKISNVKREMLYVKCHKSYYENTSNVKIWKSRMSGLRHAAID